VFLVVFHHFNYMQLISSNIAGLYLETIVLQSVKANNSLKFHCLELLLLIPMHKVWN